MAQWIKITLLSLLAIVLVLAAGTYFYLKSIGIIPKHDYETVAPELPLFTRPAILVFNKTNGFRHVDTLPVADELFRELADEIGFDVFVTDNAAVHNSPELSKFALVIWNNVSGDVLTDTQRESLQQWLQQGGGWVGVHAAGGDISYQWSWYVDTLIGTQFVGHTIDPQFQDANLHHTTLAPDITSHLPPVWRVPQEEWYAFDTSPRGKGYEILVTIDETSYSPKGKAGFGFIDTMEGEHPLVWRHRVGQGRVFYSAIGHQPATYQLPEYRKLLKQAMVWAIGDTGKTPFEAH